MMTTTRAPSRTPDSEGKIACRYCGTRYLAAGVGRHEARCTKRPAESVVNPIEARARDAARTKLAELEEHLTAGPPRNPNLSSPADFADYGKSVDRWTQRARDILRDYRTLDAVLHG